MPAAGSPNATVWCALTCTRPFDPNLSPGGTAGFSLLLVFTWIRRMARCTSRKTRQPEIAVDVDAHGWRLWCRISTQIGGWRVTAEPHTHFFLTFQWRISMFLRDLLIPSLTCSCCSVFFCCFLAARNYRNLERDWAMVLSISRAQWGRSTGRNSAAGRLEAVERFFCQPNAAPNVIMNVLLLGGDVIWSPPLSKRWKGQGTVFNFQALGRKRLSLSIGGLLIAWCFLIHFPTLLLRSLSNC